MFEPERCAYQKAKNFNDLRDNFAMAFHGDPVMGEDIAFVFEGIRGSLVLEEIDEYGVRNFVMKINDGAQFEQPFFLLYFFERSGGIVAWLGEVRTNDVSCEFLPRPGAGAWLVRFAICIARSIGCKRIELIDRAKVSNGGVETSMLFLRLWQGKVSWYERFEFRTKYSNRMKDIAEKVSTMKDGSIAGDAMPLMWTRDPGLYNETLDRLKKKHEVLRSAAGYNRYVYRLEF